MHTLQQQQARVRDNTYIVSHAHDADVATARRRDDSNDDAAANRSSMDENDDSADGTSGKESESSSGNNSSSVGDVDSSSGDGSFSDRDDKGSDSSVDDDSESTEECEYAALSVLDANVKRLHEACRKGALSVVRELLLHTHTDASALLSVDERNIDGNTPMLTAAGGGHVVVVDLLLELGAAVDATNQNGTSPLHMAAQNNRVPAVQALLTANAAINVWDASGATPLYVASQRGYAGVVQALLDANAAVDIECQDGETPLGAATSNGHFNVVQLLVAHSADVNKIAYDGCSPLSGAAASGDIASVQLLLAHNANVNATDDKNTSALYHAASGGYLGITSLLLERGACVNLARDNGSTPLYAAAYEGHLAIVHLLVANTAELEHVQQLDGTPLWIAVSNSRTDVALYLLAQGASVDVATPEDGQCVLHAAARVGELDVVCAVLERGEDVNRIDNEGRTALYYAAFAGHARVVQLLLEVGALVDPRANGGMTVLFVAAWEGHVDVVAALVEGGADVDRPDEGGSTPLHGASFQDHDDVVRALLTHDADVDKPEVDTGMTPLMIACANNNLAVARLLIEHRADVAAVAHDGQTALHFAAASGSSIIVTLLVRAERAHVAATTHDGETPLFVAAQTDNLDVVRELLTVYSIAQANAVTIAGLSPLIVAAKHGYNSIALALVDTDADVHARTVDGHSALYDAAAEGHSAIVEILLAAGAAVNATTADGTSPLFAAARKGHLAVVKVLLSHNATISHRNSNSGETPLITAAQHGHVDVVTRLLAAEASVNGTSVRGDTALIAASRGGHLVVVRKLLESSASIDAANAADETALLAGARAGHFEVIRMLLRAGATPHARSSAGDTVLTYAAYADNRSIVSELVERGALRFDAAAIRMKSTSLLQASLATLEERAERVHEFQHMWRRLVDALVRIYGYCAQLPNALDRGTVQQFAILVFSVASLLRVCTQASVFARLVASRAVVNRIHDCWRELAYFERRLNSDDASNTGGSKRGSVSSSSKDGVSNGWSSAFAQAQVELVELFWTSLRDDEELRSSLCDVAAQIEAVALLQYELNTHSDKYSTAMVALLHHALECALSQSSTNAQLTPLWFIPPHELELVVDKTIDKDSGFELPRLVKATWLGSAVYAKHFPSILSRTAFVDAVTTWSHLSHPNVVKLFGASHLHAPYSVVLEHVLSTNVRAYLAVYTDDKEHGDEEDGKGHRDEWWRAFYEAARGLKYLHQRSIFLVDLRCEHIWVNATRSAKINAFGGQNALNIGMHAPTNELPLHRTSERRASEATDAVRWQSPECMNGAPPSSASNVYALAMCIIEAMTNEHPWDDMSTDEVATVLRIGVRPERPDQCSDAEWAVLQQLMLDDPSQRPTIATVVELLKDLATQQRRRALAALAAPATAIHTTESNVMRLDTAVFPELACSISDFLQRLERKSAPCTAPSSEKVAHILARLHDIHRLLLALHKLPTDVVVRTFCDALLRFDRFLRIAVSPASLVQVAQSQLVALQSNVFHHDLDNVLDLFGVQPVDAVHTWIADATHKQATATTTAREQQPTQSSVTLNDKDDAVRIVRFASTTLNRKFQQMSVMDVNAVDGKGQHAASFVDQTWQIPLHEVQYNRDAPIGVGAFGEVYLAKWLSTRVVVKFMGYEADSSEYSRRMFEHELRVWYPLSHPHVIKLFGAGSVGKRYFVCEFASSGTLTSYLARSANRSQLWRKLFEVALGLQYLHEQNVVHNDLKCDNVLIGDNDDAKIIDFGLSCIPNNAEVAVALKRQGAQQWKSPEYLRGDRLTLASDVYGFGMCILEAATARPPWGLVSDVVVRNRVKKGVLPPQPVDMSTQYWRLVEMMCALEPEQRVSTAYVGHMLKEFAHDEVEEMRLQETRSKGVHDVKQQADQDDIENELNVAP